MPMLEPRWLTSRDTADYICVRVGDLSRLVKDGRIPAPAYNLGPKQPRWDRLALDACFIDPPATHDIQAAAEEIALQIMLGPRRKPCRSRAPAAG